MRNLLEWVLCPWRWGEWESGACSQAASLASGVGGPAVSHADRVPLRPPVCSSPFLLDLYARFFPFFNRDYSSQPPSVTQHQKATDLLHGLVSVHIHFISGASIFPRCLSPPSLLLLRGRTYFSLRRTRINIGLRTRKHCRIHCYKPSLPVLPKVYLPASSCHISSLWKNESDGAVHGAETEVASPREGDLNWQQHKGESSFATWFTVSYSIMENLASSSFIPHSTGWDLYWMTSSSTLQLNDYISVILIVFFFFSTHTLSYLGNALFL